MTLHFKKTSLDVINDPSIVYDTDKKEWQTISLELRGLPAIPLHELKELRLKSGNKIIDVVVDKMEITATHLLIKPLVCSLV